MDNKIVSVVVPVYNVATYIKECVETLVNQTYRNIEILLIDDGSTDNSGVICDELKKADQRIKVFHKANGGVSSARNLGIEKSTGDYLMFVDGDDWLDKDGIKLLVERLESTGADVCFCRKYYKNTDIKIATSLPSCTIMDVLDVARIHLHYGFIASPCFSLYTKQKIGDARFKEYIHTLEDWEFNFQVLTSVHTLSILDVPYYHYRTVEGSASKSPLNKAKMSCFRIVEAVEQRIEEKALPLRQDTELIPFFLLYHMLVAFAGNGAIDHTEVELKHIARQLLKKFLFSPRVNARQKIYALMASIHPGIFKLMYNIKNK